MDLRDLKAASEHAQSGIYKIYNTISEKFYIGSAVNLKNRWRWHIKDLKAGKHRNSRLQKSWNLHEEEAFIFIVIELCDKEKLVEREQFWLDTTQCYDDSIGYNIASVAGSSLGIKRSAETREKQRLNKLGKKQKPEHVAARVEKIKGHKVTEAQREATRKRNLGNTWGLGFKQTNEAKLKISQTHKGKPKSEEHKKKMSENSKRQFALPNTTPIDY